MVKAACVVLFGVTVTGAGVLVILLVLQRNDSLKLWLGITTLTACGINLFGQLTNITEILRTKNADSIAIEMATCLLVASIFWDIYAIIIMDPVFMVTNSLGVISGVTQIMLKKIYRKVSTATCDSAHTSEPTSAGAIHDFGAYQVE